MTNNKTQASQQVPSGIGESNPLTRFSYEESMRWLLRIYGQIEQLESENRQLRAVLAAATPGQEAVRSQRTGRLRASLETVRDDALEEAAMLCFARYTLRMGNGFPREASTARSLANDIRALKSASVSEQKGDV